MHFWIILYTEFPYLKVRFEIELRDFILDLLVYWWYPNVRAFEAFPEHDTHLFALVKEGVHRVSTAVGPLAAASAWKARLYKDFYISLSSFVEIGDHLVNFFRSLILGIFSFNFAHLFVVTKVDDRQGPHVHGLLRLCLLDYVNFLLLHLHGIEFPLLISA